MLRQGAGLFALFLAACASAPPPTPASWAACGCDWIEDIARAKAGPAMVDCGFVILVGDQPKAELHAGIRCAREAFAASTPFRYGSVRIPMDSYATEVLVRAADGSLWFLVHDVMIDGEAPQFWVQRCGQLHFKPGNSGFRLDGCKAEQESAP